ncbi:hypothetical protein [Haloarchaeobius baliensis]|uniref:hypothetical protein n=1 Tax=Haloarchaeobius baliensis TaxID=1670458 RepID=UPI003F8836C0
MPSSNVQESQQRTSRADVDAVDVTELAEHIEEVDEDGASFTYREWLLLAPAALALSYLPLVLAFGQELLYSTRGGEPHLLGFALMAALVGVAATATGHLFDDAKHVAETTDWSPNPTHYTVAGTAVVTVALVGRVLFLDGTIARPAEFVGGVVIVSVLLSSVVAGPIYVFRRRRRLE